MFQRVRKSATPLSVDVIKKTSGIVHRTMSSQVVQPRNLRVIKTTSGKIFDTNVPPPSEGLPSIFSSIGIKARIARWRSQTRSTIGIARMKKSIAGFNPIGVQKELAEGYQAVNNAFAHGDKTALKALTTDNLCVVTGLNGC
eukprot:TRINITY_DN1475_c4_g1_i1.p1 TRINITY_DN1475_c4_g1~~TRINITY_DN1475_c4_g1_i1.p1  ORF type:complete len:142 (-),score=32.55 TRINITY_DN1475_c4_g1_i1:11-436(-)